MGLFDVFKKKKSSEQPKTYICARCKKEIADSEPKWIGNHRFCNDCFKSSDYRNTNEAPKCSVCGNEVPRINTTDTMCFSCRWIKSKFSDKKESFKMTTKEGQTYTFIYSGHTRYSPNRASTCGYGSDDWMYLCEESGKNYILMFMVDASCGPGWFCTELLDGDFETLTNANVNFWGSVAHSKERNKIYSLRLTDIDGIRHLLPTSSRCGELTDESFMR